MTVNVPVNVLMVNVLKVVDEVKVADVLCVVKVVLDGIEVVVGRELIIVVVRVNKVVKEEVVRVVLVEDVLVVVVVVVVVVVGEMTIVKAVDAVGTVGITPPLASHNTYALFVFVLHPFA